MNWFEDYKLMMYRTRWVGVFGALMIVVVMIFGTINFFEAYRVNGVPPQIGSILSNPGIKLLAASIALSRSILLLQHHRYYLQTLSWISLALSLSVYTLLNNHYFHQGCGTNDFSYSFDLVYLATYSFLVLSLFRPVFAFTYALKYPRFQ